MSRSHCRFLNILAMEAPDTLGPDSSHKTLESHGLGRRGAQRGQERCPTSKLPAPKLRQLQASSMQGLDSACAVQQKPGLGSETGEHPRPQGPKQRPRKRRQRNRHDCCSGTFSGRWYLKCHAFLQGIRLAGNVRRVWLGPGLLPKSHPRRERGVARSLFCDLIPISIVQTPIILGLFQIPGLICTPSSKRVPVVYHSKNPQRPPNFGRPIC